MNNKFWSEQAKECIDWIQPWKTIQQGGFETADVQWFCEGRLNASVNCIDRHLKHKANHPALLWQGDNEDEMAVLTFLDLYREVCKMANALKSLGIKKGDTVAIYLPLIPEAVISILACARIGIIHSVVFAGFSAQALENRLIDCKAKCLITADGYQRAGHSFSLKSQADAACQSLSLIKIVIKHNGALCKLDSTNDYWWHELREKAADTCIPEAMKAEDPLFILYTSGSTGKPKGLLHTHGGYLVQTTSSHRLIFNCRPHDVFWCTADVGWITGHSYVVYGTLSNGITTLLFSGTPTWPTPDRYWKIIDKYQVAVLYTAPTAIRAIRRAGDEWLQTSSRDTLRLLGSVGEPINPEVWQWYFEKVGKSQCPIVDTWWQTETGAIMMSPTGTSLTNKPGAACKPLPGIKVVLLDKDLQELSENVARGDLSIKYPWPAMARTILGDHERYKKTYFKKGYYITGDSAHRDQEGDYWIDGRIDDVINVSGHRLGTAEVENALLWHPLVAEAVVVGVPHEVKGQGIHAFIVLKKNTQPDPHLQQELVLLVSQSIGAFAKPEAFTLLEDLPKTRSGKILRRIIKQIITCKITDKLLLGDLSTIANPETLDILIKIITVHKI